MKGKIIWLSVSCLMALSLVLASCGPAVTEEEEEVVTEEEEEVVTEEEEEVVTEEEEEEELVLDTLGRLVEEPKYGGWITTTWDIDLRFHPADFEEFSAAGMMYETLVFEDITKGPAGTGEYLFSSTWSPEASFIGSLAESWEQTDATTFIVYLRQGVRWWNKPPVNGREVVADDVVFSFRWLQAHPRNHYYLPPEVPDEERIQATALDKYTVEIKIPAPNVAGLTLIGFESSIVPSEIEEWEESELDDWKNAVGTGPFIPVDYVSGSSLTMDRNPDYWQYDPFHPDNQLPYADGFKQLIISDMSVRQAALRTGAIDQLWGITYLEQQSLEQQAPHLKSRGIIVYDNAMLFPNVSKEPFSKKKVRQALFMAINYDEIVEDYYDGQAVPITWPYGPEHAPLFTPMEELPDNVRELYSYNPERARELLTEAGYPDGITTEVVTIAKYVEELSLLQEYFAAIGVDMEIKVWEAGAFNTVWRPVEELGYSRWGNSSPYYIYVYAYKPAHLYNNSRVDDPYIVEEYAKVALEPDRDERTRIMKDLGVYAMEQAYTIDFPASLQYMGWQPWLKVYSGEFSFSYWNRSGWARYAWIDQDLKAELGY